MFLNGNVQLLFKCCTSLLKYSYQGGTLTTSVYFHVFWQVFSLFSVLQTCFQNPLANLTLTPFDNSPEAPSDSMTGVSYSLFFIPKVVNSPTSHSAFQFHEYQTLLFVQSQLYNAISKLFLKEHQTVLPS